MLPITPRGFKDILPEEARIREQLRKSASLTFDLWGYDPIETPTLEMLEVLERGSALSSPSFKLFDEDGSLLVMRPDATLPIARMVASRLGEQIPKYRFRYDLRVLRDNKSDKATSREFTQLGVEQIGYSGSEADAETIIVFIESLLACGLRGFKVDFCNVAILKSLIKSCNLSEQDEESILNAYHSSNHVGLAYAVENLNMNKTLAKCLKGLIKIHGDHDAIVECKKLLCDCDVDQSPLDLLEETWEIIEDCGYADYIGIDFSLMSSFDYYTGLILFAYAPGFGKEIGSGGRYDKLLKSFGRDVPAAGFAFSLENLMQALSVQGNLKSTPRDIEYVEEAGSASFKKAMALHSKGIVASIGGDN